MATQIHMPKCQGIDIEELSIGQLQHHLSTGNFTSTQLTECYLQRIKLLNPRIKAIVEINPDALTIAQNLDDERQVGKIRSKIHGIPFLVKDNIATRDKMLTTAGSAALINTRVAEDARVVSLLREAGGVLIGKANMSEWACMRATYYAEGYSSRGGQNRNPYNLAEHAGGSSSGSASGLAANMCAFSIGTETDGSVMFPADRNGVVGIKPTVGLTSTAGIIPEAPSMDTVGVFGRSVADAVIVLDVIAEKQSLTGMEASQSDSFKSASKEMAEYEKFLVDKDALRGARFGLPGQRVWDRVWRNETHDLGCRKLVGFVKRLEAAGANILTTDFPSADATIPPEGWDWTFAEGKPGSCLSEVEVVNVEFYHSLREYLSRLEENKDRILSLEDVMAYNIEHNLTEGGIPGTIPAWPTGQDGFDNCIRSVTHNESKYHKALEYMHRTSREEGIDAALQHAHGQLDVLLVPLQADGGVACSIAARAGYPMITVPVDVGEDGVPFGIGLMQTAGNEHVLVQYASAIEDLIGHKNRPLFLNFDAENHPMIGNPPPPEQSSQ